MTNSDVLRRIRYTFNLRDEKVVAIFSHANCEVTEQQVQNWLKKDDEPEMIEIADDSRKDTKVIFTSSGEEIPAEDKEWTGRVRMMLDTRKFIASKLKPKKYGDKLDLTTDGEKIQQTIVWGGKQIKI